MNVRQRIISLVLLIVVCFISITHCSKITSFAEESITQGGTRYTVLAIDISGSMSGNPLNAAKKSAKKFCSAMMASEGKNYISLIAYNSFAYAKCDFTDSLDEINNIIDGLSASGGTNTNEALLKMESFVDQIPSFATKNIVLLSDGLPESGTLSGTGPYTPLDHSGYQYGNAVYNTATNLKNKCNVYTLGFFHSLSGNDRTFGQKLMEDIQNKGYFNVENPDNLEFVFGEIFNTMTDTTLKRLWIQQHKQYLNSDQYRKDIINGYSDYLLGIAENDVGNAKVITYNTLVTMNKFLGTTDWGYKDEYEFILAQLMMSENGYKGIQENFTANLLQNFSDGGKYVIDFLKDSLVSSKDAEDIKDLNRMEELFNFMMQDNVDWRSKVYNSAYSEYKTLVNKHMSAKDMQKTLSKKFDFASTGYEILMNTASETLEYIAYGEAYMSVSNDYKAVLLLMYYQVGQNIADNDEEGLRFVESMIQYEYLSQALEEFIIALEEYKSDKGVAIRNFAGRTLCEETVNEAVDVAITNILSSIPTLKKFAVLRESLETGVDLIDVLTTIDDYAYAGNMVGRLYYFTKVMYNVVEQCGDNLQATNESDIDKSFYYASVFDEAIMMYKATIGVASDYAKEFEEVTLVNELSKPDPNQKKVSWYSSAALMAATQKLVIEQVCCHNTELKYDHVFKKFDDDTDLKIFTVACPVAVKVTDNTGKQVAYLSDNSMNIASGYEQYFNVFDIGNEYVKIALVPKDYTVSIYGTGNGTMDAYVASLKNYEISDYQAFGNMIVTEETTGFFDKQTDDKYNLTVDGQKQEETTKDQNNDENYEDVYDEANSITKNNVTITLNKAGYNCQENGTFTVKAKITVPEEYEYGSHKYIGYFAYLYKGRWEQISSWWIDGGTLVYPIKMTIHEWENKGQNLFVVSVFPSDNFATGGSLCDKVFSVNISSIELADADNNSKNDNTDIATESNYSNIKNINISFDANGGGCSINAITRRYLDVYGELPVPTKEGYIFEGWYTEQNGQGIKVLPLSTVTVKADHIIYANWIRNEELSQNSKEDEKDSTDEDTNDGKVVTYYIDYKLDGGIVSGNPNSFTEETDTFTLQNPTRDGYTFVGWTGSNGNIPQTTVTIEKGSIGDKCYIANWKKDSISISVAKISGIKSAYTYTGKKLVPSPTVKVRNKTLKNGTDYIVAYKSNRNVGTVTVTIQGKGSYIGTKKVTFRINPKGTSFTNLKKGLKKITVKWKKQAKQTTGYEIQYSTSSEFVKGMTGTIIVKKTSTTSTTIKSLKAKKKYYVRIRTYKTVAGKKYYSGWSKVLNIVTK